MITIRWITIDLKPHDTSLALTSHTVFGDRYLQDLGSSLSIPSLTNVPCMRNIHVMSSLIENLGLFPLL